MLKLNAIQKTKLAQYAHRAFCQAYSFRWPQVAGASRPAKQEPEQVATMVVKGTALLRQQFMPFLQTLYPTAQISSVFVHQSPYVNWNGGKQRCELGDLLLVVRPDPVADPCKGYALILQTKMSSIGTVKTPDPIQYSLYTTWPPFDLEASGGLGFTCTLTPTLSPAMDFGRYGLIIRPGAAKSSRAKWKGRRRPWAVLTPAMPLHANSGAGLADALVSVMQGHAGAAFNGNGDDWSKLVNHLLANTFSQPLTLNSLLSPMVPPALRGQHAFLALAFSSAGWTAWSLAAKKGQRDVEGYRPRFPVHDGPAIVPRAGISTILIDLTANVPG